jgi:hypothetical protein
MKLWFTILIRDIPARKAWKVIIVFQDSVLDAEDFNLVMKTKQGIARLRIHRLGLDSNVILVQHTERGLHFQVS